MAELELAGSAVALATDIPRAVEFDGIAGLAFGCAAVCGQALDARRLFAMRTRHAASSVGAGRLCGQVAIGLSADIVIEKPHDLAVDPAWEATVLSGRRTVRDVIVAGRRVFSDGECLAADGELIRAQAKASAQEILSRIGA